MTTDYDVAYAVGAKLAQLGADIHDINKLQRALQKDDIEEFNLILSRFHGLKYSMEKKYGFDQEDWSLGMEDGFYGLGDDEEEYLEDDGFDDEFDNEDD